MKATVFAAPHELPAERVWGTGGWLPPEERRALDWLTFFRLLGWPVTLERGEPRVIVDDAVTIVATPGTGVRGRRLEWVGPGDAAAWSLRGELEATRVDGDPWLLLDGAPVAAARDSTCVLGFDPSGARDAEGAVTAALRHLVTRAIHGPVAWLDFDRTMVLRMDDPGGAQNVHFEAWRYRELDAADWAAIDAELAARDARLSVAAVGGWIDDGDPARGTLEVHGAPAERVPGRVHPTADVRYRDAGGVLHDYAGEFAKLRALDRVDVQLHGHTHVHPDWPAVPDRYTDERWFRELGAGAGESLAAGIDALERAFGTRPATLVCPGDEWTHGALVRALDLGIELVDSYYLAVRDGDRLCWCQHVCAPYLDTADPSWFDAGLPVVGYFHAREPSVDGVPWLARNLDAWRAAGAERFIGFDDLAAALRDGVATRNPRVRIKTR